MKKTFINFLTCLVFLTIGLVVSPVLANFYEISCKQKQKMTDGDYSLPDEVIPFVLAFMNAYEHNFTEKMIYMQSDNCQVNLGTNVNQIDITDLIINKIDDNHIDVQVYYKVYNSKDSYTNIINMSLDYYDNRWYITHLKQNL